METQKITTHYTKTLPQNNRIYMKKKNDSTLNKKLILHMKSYQSLSSPVIDTIDYSHPVFRSIQKIYSSSFLGFKLSISIYARKISSSELYHYFC